MKLLPVVVFLSFVFGALVFTGEPCFAEEDEINCIKCHRRVTPGHIGPCNRVLFSVPVFPI